LWTDAISAIAEVVVKVIPPLIRSTIKCMCTIFRPSEISWCVDLWINASLKDDDDIQRQVKSLYCAANKLGGTFDQCSPAVKKHFISCLLHANGCLPIVEQIHPDHL